MNATAAASVSINPNHGRTILVAGRQYAVEAGDSQRDTDEGRPVYILTGARGARYATMRNANNPERMFLVHAGKRGFGPVRLGEAHLTWLTDAGGELREVA